MSSGKITERAKNRWTSVLPMLGVNEKILDGKHHPCPSTGQGDDRFRFSNKNGRGNFFCACNDGKGDAFKLLECMFGWDFRTAAGKVEEIIGEAGEDAEDAKKVENVIRDLRMIQRKVRDAASDIQTRTYLAGRGIDLDKVYRPGVLHDATLNYGLRSAGIERDYHAMVAKVMTHDGKPSTFHLTYLEHGRKAKITYTDGDGKARRRDRIVATPVLPMAGGAVRLMPMRSDGVLGVGEGIETCYSAAQLFDVPVWAALNAQQLEKFVPPAGCKKLIIFGDNDNSATGQAAAWALAKRCALKYQLDYEVRIPLRTGDYNDVLVRGV